MSKGILWAIPNEPIVIPRRYPNGNPHHITLVYGCERSDVEEWIGKLINVWMSSVEWNDRIQAIRCVLPEDTPFAGIVPHVTASWLDGAKPVESTGMLQLPRPGCCRLWGEAIEMTIVFHEWEARS